jgi:hypothetical protein
VRDPSRQRLDAPPIDELDDDDEDISMLATLAEQAEREASGSPTPPPAKARHFSVRADDQLDVFREIQTERPRPRVLETVGIADVELDDLVEQLATTAAALRRRLAA